MLAPATHFPEAFVAVGPDFFQMREQFPLQVPTGFNDAQAALARLVRRVHDLAEDVEL